MSAGSCARSRTSVPTSAGACSSTRQEHTQDAEVELLTGALVASASRPRARTDPEPGGRRPEAGHPPRVPARHHRRHRPFRGAHRRPRAGRHEGRPGRRPRGARVQAGRARRHHPAVAADGDRVRPGTGRGPRRPGADRNAPGAAGEDPAGVRQAGAGRLHLRRERGDRGAAGLGVVLGLRRPAAVRAGHRAGRRGRGDVGGRAVGAAASRASAPDRAGRRAGEGRRGAANPADGAGCATRRPAVDRERAVPAVPGRAGSGADRPAHPGRRRGFVPGDRARAPSPRARSRGRCRSWTRSDGRGRADAPTRAST